MPDPTRIRRGSLWTRPFTQAYIAHLFSSMSYHTMVLFPLFVQKQGGDEFQIGVLAALGLTGGILLRWGTAPVWERISFRVLFAIGGFLAAAGASIFLFVNGLGVDLVVGRILNGAGAGLFFATFFAYLVAICPPGRRAAAIGVFGTGGMIGGYRGVHLSELVLARFGFSGLFATSIVTALLGLAGSLTLPHQNQDPTLTRPGPSGGPEDPRAPEAPADPHGLLVPLWSICGLFGLVISATFVFLAPFAESAGLRPIWPFFLAYSGAAVLVRLLAGDLPDRLGHRRVLWPALICFAAGVWFLPRATGVPGLFACGVLGGLGHGYAFPCLSALIVSRAGGRRRGRYMNLFTSFVDVGQLAGGPLLGLMAREISYGFLFTTVAFVLLAGSTLLLGLDRYLDRRRRPS